jgi:hypothetical protein
VLLTPRQSFADIRGRIRLGARRVAVVAVGAAALVGCDSSPSGPQGPATVEEIIVMPDDVQVPRGGEVQLVVTLRDANGNVLTEPTVTFQSASTGVAQVTTGGLVRGVQVGTTQITVRSGGESTVVPVTVLPGNEPVIESISPAVLGEDMEIEILGRQFSPNPSLNTVRIGGTIVTVLEASTTRLLVRTPERVCVPSGTVQVVVEVGGDASAPANAPFEAGEAVALAPGEFRLLTGDAAGCLRLPATTGAASYVVGIQSTTGNADFVTPVLVTGTRGQPQPGADAGFRALPVRPVSAPFADVAQALVARSRVASDLLPRHHAEEERLRAREKEVMERLVAMGSPFVAMQRARALGSDVASGVSADATSAVKVPATVEVGDTLTINVPDIRPGVSFCSIGIPVEVIVRRVGSGSIWLEDVLNPPPGLSASDYSFLGAQFDDITLPRLRSHFGDPTDLDGNGRIVVVISQQVNRFGNILGFVVSTDFAPTEFCPASNVGEFYYSITPDPLGEIPVPTGREAVELTVDEFRSETPRLAAHETTHIIQFGRRIQSGATSLGTIWELEGQAVLGEEVVGFDALGLGPRQNLGFEVAFNPSNASPVDWFINAFVDLAVYYGFQFETPTTRTPGAPAECSWLDGEDVSGPCDYPRLPYGVSWSFLRWLSDHYGDQFAGGEAELHRRLVEASVSGFPAIEEVVGESKSPLLAYWAASLYTDGRLPPGADPRLSFPSWDLRAIEAGLVETARLQPQGVSFNGFTTSRSVAAGSSHYMTMSGFSPPGFAIRTTTQAGSPLPGHMQLWVVRLQ